MGCLDACLRTNVLKDDSKLELPRLETGLSKCLKDENIVYFLSFLSMNALSLLNYISRSFFILNFAYIYDLSDESLALYEEKQMSHWNRILR